MNVVDFKHVLPAAVFKTVFLLGLALSLVACGGGGSEDGDEGNPYQGNPNVPDINVPEVTCDDLSCEDGDPCTLPTCEDAECTYEPSVGTECDDGNACSLDDACSEDGLCVGATSQLCEDGNTCTDDTCDTKSGCVFINHEDGYPCTDGDPCTLGDGCAHGICSGSPKSCPDDDNSCTADAGCEPDTGDCLTLVLPDGNACDDDNLCTTDDFCEGGTCLAGGGLVCDDLNLCTDDSCTPKGGCVFEPNIIPCDDGTACTMGDVCSQGSCQGAPLDCEDENECTAVSCDPAIGCQYANLEKACEDGNLCTVGDLCVEGDCLSGSAKVCEDGNACTTENCELETGLCAYTPNQNNCDDGDLCTTGDVCSQGSCVGGALTCNDDNPCTEDGCDSLGGCTYISVTKPCEDGDLCTVGTQCVDGICGGGTTDDCDDGNLCTSDSCDSSIGCVHTPTAASCDDGDACTVGEYCAEGECASGVVIDCSDDNLCTDDDCNAISGCFHPLNQLPCDDGDACTLNDVCAIGSCTSGDPANCDDGDLCTNDACDSAIGCTHENNELPCDDDNACTTGDACAGGECVGGAGPNCDDLNPCTTDGCAVETGCTHENNTDLCDDDSACTTDDTCAGGECVGGLPPGCDDNNPCTDEGCDTVEGCTHTFNVDLCDDGDECTLDDICSAGSCAGPGILDCNDGNGCTDDACDPVLGCVYTDNTLSCDDGDACTEGDVCSGGSCLSGAPVNCDDGLFCNGLESCDVQQGCLGGDAPAVDDGVSCTVDSCDESSDTIVHLPTDSLCDDGAYCTGVETCDSVADCQAGTPPIQDDGISCTVSVCDENLDTIVHVPDNGLCESGSPCIEDICDVSAGGCISTTELNCCGNGLPEAGEDCDDSDADDGDGCSSNCLFEACGYRVRYLIGGQEINSVFSDDTFPEEVALSLGATSASPGSQGAGVLFDDLLVTSSEGLPLYSTDFVNGGNWVMCTEAGPGSANISNGTANAIAGDQNMRLSGVPLFAQGGLSISFWAQLSDNTASVALEIGTSPQNSCDATPLSRVEFAKQSSPTGGAPVIRLTWGMPEVPDFVLATPWSYPPNGWHFMEVHFEPDCQEINVVGNSCADALAQNPSLETDLYWIDPDEIGGASPFKVLCDMETKGGGWTQVATYGFDGRPEAWTGNDYPRPGASFYGKPHPVVLATNYNGQLENHSVDGSMLWENAAGEVLLYVAGAEDDYVTVTLPKTCNFFDGTTLCEENTYGPLTVYHSNSSVLTTGAYACTTAHLQFPWSLDNYDEFGLHLLDGLDNTPKHCFEGGTSLGVQNKGRIFTTFEGGMVAPLYWSKGIHSSWTNSLDQSGAVFVR